MTIDLSTRYLGLTLNNPLGASAGPLTGNLDSLRRLEAAGASVVVLPSLFEEQIRHEELEIERLYEYQAESFAESLTYFPELEDYNTGPHAYLRRVEAAKRAVSIPVIGRLIFGQDPVFYISIALTAAVMWFLFKTRTGLTLRSIGDSHSSAHALGIKVIRYRYLAVIFGGGE